MPPQDGNPSEPAASGVRRVARNAAVPLLAGLAGRVLAWGFAVYMARLLGPVGTGEYAFAVNLWLYASIVTDFGLGTWLTREIARDPGAGQHLVRESLGLRLVLSLIAVPVLLLFTAVYAQVGGYGWPVLATVALLAAGLFPGAVSAAGTALFNAHERMIFPAGVQLLSAMATTLAGVAVLASDAGIVGLGWVSLAVNTLTAALFYVACRRRFFALGLSLDLRRHLAIARETVPLMLNSLLNNVFFRFDVQVLQTKGSAVVGYYSNAYKVIDAAGAVPSSFVLALFPVLSRRATGSSGPEGLLRVYRLALKLLLAVALPIVVLIAFGATELTRWFWGPAFLPHSAVALQILIWFLPLSFFNGLTQYVLIALGLQRRITAAFALAAVFNLAANLALVPRYSYVAAAAITIVSEVVLLVPFLVALRGSVRILPILVAALRPVPAGLVMGAVLWGLAPWSRPGATLLACLTYPVALVFSAAFSAPEMALMHSLIPARLRIWARLAGAG